MFDSDAHDRIDALEKRQENVEKVVEWMMERHGHRILFDTEGLYIDGLWYRYVTGSELDDHFPPK